MKNKKECKIVQNLLPNYIDKLTDDEINQYIEEHIQQCEECKNQFDIMIKELKLINQNKKSQTINYMKKFKNKIRNFKFIIISMILLVIIVFVVTIGKRMIIINDLSNKAKKYVNPDNFYCVSYIYGENGKFDKTEYYKLDNKLKIVNVSIEDDKVFKQISFGTKEKEWKNSEGDIASTYSMKHYFEIDDRKILLVDSSTSGELYPVNLFYTENFGELLECAIKTPIKEKSFRGKECYYLDSWKTKAFGNTQNNLYIDKENGLKKYSNDNDGYIWEERYEFGKVKEDDFIELDALDYEIMTSQEFIKTFEK